MDTKIIHEKNLKNLKETLYNLYAIKDTLMGFEQIYLLPNNASAIRWFGDMATNKESPIAKHAENYQLFKIGTLNEQTGELLSDLQFLENASTFTSK